MADAGLPTREMAEAVEREVPVEVVPQDDRAESSENSSSDAKRESDTVSQNAEGSAKDADDASHSYWFGPSTITVSRIREMSDLRYFVEGDARAPGEEVVPNPADDEAIVF